MVFSYYFYELRIRGVWGGVAAPRSSHSGWLRRQSRRSQPEWEDFLGALAALQTSRY